MRKLIRVLSIGSIVLALSGAPAAHAVKPDHPGHPPRPLKPVDSPPAEQPPSTPPGETNGYGTLHNGIGTAHRP